MAQSSNRAPWILAVTILLAGLVVILTLLFMPTEAEKCEEWQAKVRDGVRESGLSVRHVTSTTLGNERPEGCPKP